MGKPSATSKSSAAPRGRAWLKRVLMALLAPVVFLVLVEVVLRVFNIALPTSFIRPLKVGDEKVLVENDAFGLRFFPPAAARHPETIRLPIVKTDELRIAVLGESAAMGDPLPEYGAARMLEVILQAQIPDRRVRVINAAMTAINSHVIKEIARDLARIEPDIVIILMGNNEVLGPFGPSSLNADQDLLPLWRIQAHAVITRLRMSTYLSTLRSAIDQAGVDYRDWTGLQAFVDTEYDPDAPLRDEVRQRFRLNLEEIVSTATEQGCQVMLCTIPVNLYDWPPFASGKASDSFLVATLRARAGAAMEQSDWTQARALWEEILEEKPGDAEALYGLAHTLLATGDADAAAAKFAAARDADRLPFRTDAQQQEHIRSVARQFNETSLTFLDLASLWHAYSNPVLVDRAGFVDHVHFSWKGNYWVANRWAETTLAMLGREKEASNWPDETAVSIALAATSTGQQRFYTMMQERLERPPFSAMDGLGGHRARFREILDELAGEPQALQELDRAIIEAPRAREDGYTLLRLAELHARHGRLDEADNLTLRALAASPHSIDVAATAAQSLFARGRAIEAIAVYDRASYINPYARSALAYELAVEFIAGPAQRPGSATVKDWALTHTRLSPDRAAQLVEALLRRGWFDEAHDAAGVLYQRHPKHTGIALYRCKTALAVKNIDEAARALARADALSPGDAEVVYHQAIIDYEQGRAEDARRAFERVIEMNPAHPDAPGQWALLMLDFFGPEVLDQWLEGQPAYDAAREAQWWAIVQKLRGEGDGIRVRRLIARARAINPENVFLDALFAWSLLNDQRSPDDRARALAMWKKLEPDTARGFVFYEQLAALVAGAHDG